MVLCCTFNSGTVIVRTTKRRGAQHFQSLILSLRPARNTVIRSSVILLCVGGIVPITDPGDRRISSPRRGAPASVEAESISLWSIHDGWRVCCSALGRADSVCSACAEQGAWSTTVSDGSVRAPMGYQGQAKRFAVCNALYRQRHCRCDNISRSNARPPHSASSVPSTVYVHTKGRTCTRPFAGAVAALCGGSVGRLNGSCRVTPRCALFWRRNFIESSNMYSATRHSCGASPHVTKHTHPHHSHIRTQPPCPRSLTSTSPSTRSRYYFSDSMIANVAAQCTSAALRGVRSALPATRRCHSVRRAPSASRTRAPTRQSFVRLSSSSVHPRQQVEPATSVINDPFASGVHAAHPPKRKHARASDMAHTDATVGFIGTGLITRAVVTGLCTSKAPPKRIVLSPRSSDVGEELVKQFGRTHDITVAPSNQHVVDSSDWVVIATPPSSHAE